MEKLTLRAYAQKHKLSFFNVLKMIKSNELKSVMVEENGKEVEYIVLEKETEEKVTQTIAQNASPKMSLEEENKRLKEEIERLKAALEKCNRRTLLA